MAKASPVSRSGPSSLNRTDLWPAALILVATILAYWPAFSGEFIWNDSDYVTAPALRPLGGLARIWTEPGAVEQYYPLLHSAFWVQHQLWGDNPLGYHVVTVLLHAAAALLFGLVVRRLLAPGSLANAGWLAALLFALHPVHVESVAWIAEQKNTLSLACYLGAALAYLRFDETRRPRLYAAASVLFLASMGCKTSTVTLPAALLVVFWWLRGTLSWRRDVLPLLPWLVAGVAAGLFSSWVEQQYLGAKGEDFDQPALARLLVAGRAVWFYAASLAWPAGLNFVYPRWAVDASAWWQWLHPLGAVTLGILLWVLRGRSRAPLAAYLLFVGALFPVLGFVNLYGARYSWVWDHWQYLADLGPIALVAAGLARLTAAVAPGRGWANAALLASLALGLGSLTWSHSRMFRDNETLYQATLARNPECWMAYNNLGVLRSHQPGRLAEAIDLYQASLRLNPDNAEAHNNLGEALAKIPGRLGDAIAEFETALRLLPGNPRVHNNLGNALAQTPGRIEEAIRHYQEALRRDPAYFEAHYNLANALAKRPGRLDDAIAHYETALRLQPDFVPGWCNLGVSRAQQGNLPEAEKAFRAALLLAPDNAFARQALARVRQESTVR